MTELFVRVLQYSLWGGVTAGVILLVKAAVAGRLSPRFHYLIWLVLLAKLLLPGGIESPISPFRLTAPLE